MHTTAQPTGRRTSGEATGGGELNSPTVLPLSTHEICAEPMRKYWDTPHPRNVVPAKTLVLVAHLVTFSESQWNQFHPRAKKPTASLGSAWPPSAALPLDPAGDSAAHTSPCTFSLTPPAELRQNKQPKRSPYLLQIITFVTNVIMRLTFIARQHTGARYWYIGILSARLPVCTSVCP